MNTTILRVITIFLIFILTISSMSYSSPIPVEEKPVVRPESKIAGNLLNKTSSEEEIDALVGYNDDMIDFKMSNALSFTERVARVVEIYEDIEMARVRILGTDLLRLARNELVANIWPNEVMQIQQPKPSNTSTSTEDDYLSIVDLVGAREIWEKGYNGSGAVIAVLDTGIDSNHSDLQNVAASASFVEIDALPTDILGPGTYAASIAAGSGNASEGKYSGIAPGATLLAGKVTFGGILALGSWIVSGIEWASSNGADIILLPFNTFGAPNDAVAQAVATAVEKGIFVIAAAGDDGPDYLTIMSPGGGIECFTVGAYDTYRQEVPAFSGRGPSLALATKPDLVAPGVGIVGARIGAGLAGFGFGDTDLGDVEGVGGLLGGSKGENIDEHYKVADTTAASAAIVAGAAALLMSAFDRATPIVIGNVLRETATKLAYGANDAGAGLLNLPAAFDYLSRRQEPIEIQTRRTGSALLAFGLVTAAGNNVTSIMMMSSYGTSLMTIDSRGPNTDIHMLLGMFSIKWNNMEPTNLMNFKVKRELHLLTPGTTLGILGGAINDSSNIGNAIDTLQAADPSGYGRWVGILSYDDELFVTLLVESYNFTRESDLPLTAYKITPFILDMGQAPIDNVSLYLSYSLDIFNDGQDDFGKYDLTDKMLFAYGISEDYRDFYLGINSSRELDAFEVGNSSEIADHISNDSLTGSTTFEGSVGLGMKWDFGRIYPGTPVNVSVALGFGENRTVLDASIDALWEATPPTTYTDQGDFISVSADIPRTARTDETYKSKAMIMNIGEIPSEAIAAMVIQRNKNETGTLFAQYFTFDEIKPFHAEYVETEWSPEEQGKFTAGWIATVGITDMGSILGLQQSLSTSALRLLDDFLLRDLFVEEPIPSTSVFPRELPFAPFDVRFPIDFGLYTISLSTTQELGNLTVHNVGNASEWGNATLTPAESVTGFYNFSIFVLVPPITMDGYHRCDYVINTDAGWTANITLERIIEYPRSLVLMDTSHGGGFSSFMGDSFDIGSSTSSGNDTGGFGGLPGSSFVLSQDMGGNGENISDLESLTDILDAMRLTTFSGLSLMETAMADKGIEILELPGVGLDETFSMLAAAVMIVAPTKEFNSTDIETYREFSESGGKLIIFGDSEDRVNLTGLNPLLQTYGYYMQGEHDTENTTEIVPNSLLGKGMQSMYLGGGTYIYNNQSGSSVLLNGKPVVLVDDTAPELILFGSSRIFMNDNLVKCNNSILLDNFIEYLLQNTLTTSTSLAENKTRYEVGKSVYLNLYVTDYYGNPVDDLFVAIAFELPNGSLAFFIAGFVENGLYSSQFLPMYWRDDGVIHGIFIILREEYAGTYASVSFELYKLPPTNTTLGPKAILTMVQVAILTSIGTFGGMFALLMFNRYRRKKRMRIPEIDLDLARDIDNTLNMLRATLAQINEQILREDFDRIQKVETLRGLMVTLEIAKKKFNEISGRIGGV